MGKTAHVTAIIVHGAGSTGAAACALVGAGRDTVLVEDRTGDVDAVVARVEAAVAAHAGCSSVIGVSLGAHAVARWASTTSLPLPRLVCALPAWIGEPAAVAAATAASARAVAIEGATAVLARLAASGEHADVVDLLRRAWSDYDDAALERCLLRASEGRGPLPSELGTIRAPVTIVGWLGDALHPASVARDWAALCPRSVIAMAARPEARLLRRALATVGGTG